jgi:hypothetical protein
LLRDWKLDSRTRIIYNRCQASSVLTKADVEDVLGAEVFAMIDNDYAALQQALMNGRPVDMDTPLGRAYTRLVHKILGVDKAAPSVAEKPHFWQRLRGIIQPVRKLLAPPAAGPQVLQPEIVAAAEAGAGLSLARTASNDSRSRDSMTKLPTAAPAAPRGFQFTPRLVDPISKRGDRECLAREASTPNGA